MNPEVSQLVTETCVVGAGQAVPVDELYAAFLRKIESGELPAQARNWPQERLYAQNHKTSPTAFRVLAALAAKDLNPQWNHTNWNADCPICWEPGVLMLFQSADGSCHLECGVTSCPGVLDAVGLSESGLAPSPDATKSSLPAVGGSPSIDATAPGSSSPESASTGTVSGALPPAVMPPPATPGYSCATFS